MNILSLGMTVNTNENTAGRRDYAKRFYCAFCEQPLAKIMRHYKCKHKKERQVAQIMACKSKAIRDNLMTKLRNLGNHLHNLEVLKSGEGQLKVVYRPKQERGHVVWNYVPCTYCLGYYLKSDLWKHVQRCPLREGKAAVGIRHVELGRALLPVPKDTSKKLWKIITSMYDDSVANIIRSDGLIMALGEHLLFKHGHDRSRYGILRGQMRMLGRLLQQLRSMYGENHKWRLEHFINPKYFQEVVTATRKLAGYKEDHCSYSKPSLALKLGSCLKKCAVILKGKAIAVDDEAKIKVITRFVELHELEWNVKISCTAHRNISHAKQNNVTLPPLSNDVKLLADFLKREITEEMQKLKRDNRDKEAYSELQQALLTLLIVFNRRRAGEVSKMTLRDYGGQHDPMDQAEEYDMSELEKNLCSYFKRVQVVGKRGRLVPILLTPLMTEALSLLFNCRDEMKISADNIYMFACMYAGSENHIRGTETLRRYSAACGAERPEALRSTKLRKHIATMTQVLDLRDNELDVVAQFLGHNIQVHREYYRLPESTVQTVKVSKILLALEQGALSSQSGKTIRDMEVDVNGEETGGEKLILQMRYKSVDLKLWISLSAERDEVEKVDSSSETSNNLGMKSPNLPHSGTQTVYLAVHLLLLT
mgnify:CR=1 FL=1